MTALWLRQQDSAWGAGRKLLTLTRSSTAAVTSVTNTITSSAAAGISPTDVAGGQALAWWFRVGADCTFAGQVTARMRGVESNALANCGWSIQLDLCTVSAVLASIIPQTNLPAGGAASEMSSVADAATNLSSIQIPTPVTVHAGDFIRLYVRIVPVGTMAAGYTATMSYDGPTTGAVGDTWVIITDAFTDYQPEVLQAQLPGPLKTTLAATQKNSAVLTAKLPVAKASIGPQPITGARFDGTAGEHIDLTAGGVGAAGTGAHTLAVLWYQTPTGFTNRLAVGLYAGATMTRELINVDGPLFGAGDFSNGVPGITTAKWWFAAISKPAGQAHYRIHMWGYATDGSGTMTHGESSNAANHGDGGAITSIQIGNGDVVCSADIAVVGVWNSVLSDAQLDTLKAANLAAWQALGPQALIDLHNWNGTTGAVDVVGTSAQTGVSGTVAVGASPPSFDYSLATSNAGAWAAKLPLVASTIAATALNAAVTGGQVASVLTSAMAATQADAGLTAGQLPLLSGLSAGTLTNAAVLTAKLPVLAGYVFDTTALPAVLTPKLPVLTALVTGTNNNLGVLTANLPRASSTVNDLVPVLIRQSAVDDQGAAGGTTQTCTLTGQLTPGSVILAAVTVAAPTLTPTFADTAGLVWHLIGSFTFATALGTAQGLYWARNATANATLALTVTYGSIVARRSVHLVEVTGLDPTDATLLDAAPTASTSTTTTLSTNPASPTTPGDFLFAFVTGSQTATPAGGNTGGTVATRTTNTLAVTAYRLLTGAPTSWMDFSLSSATNSQALVCAFRPAGTHTPRSPQAVAAAYQQASGAFVGLPSTWQPGNKALCWVHVSWPDAAFHTAADVAVAGFTNAGWSFGSDNTSGTALWAGWRDLQTGDGSFQLTVAGAGAIADVFTEVPVFDAGAPVGSPWGPNGVSGANAIFSGGQSVPAAKTPASSLALNTVFGWTGQLPTTMAGTTPSTLNWTQRTPGTWGNYLWEAPSHDGGRVSAAFSPPGANPTIALFGQIENGSPSVPGVLSVALPRLTGLLNEVPGIAGVLTPRLPLLSNQTVATQVVSGTLAASLPLATSSAAATQAVPGVLTASLPIATSQTIATQTDSAVWTGTGLPVLRGLLYEGNIPANLSTVLPLLAGASAATQLLTGGTATPKLPLLTNQTSADNLNQAVLAAALPHPLVAGIPASQTNTGSTISFLPFPLLTAAVSGVAPIPAVLAPKLPLLTGSVTGLAAGQANLAPSLPRLSSTIAGSTTNQASLSGQVGSVLTGGATGTLQLSAVTAGRLPLLTGVLGNAVPGSISAVLPLVTATLTATILTIPGSVAGTFPSLLGTLFGTPVVGADLSTAALPLLTTTLTGDFTIRGVAAAPLPLLRTHLHGDSLGAVYLDVTVSAAPTRAGGMRVGAGGTHTLTLAGAAGTRADTVAAGDTRGPGITAADTRAQRGPR